MRQERRKKGGRKERERGGERLLLEARGAAGDMSCALVTPVVVVHLRQQKYLFLHLQKIALCTHAHMESKSNK